LGQQRCFLRAKKLQKKVREEIRIDLKDITKVNKEEVVNNFISHLAVIDSINEDKKLFHYVVNNKIHGIIRFDETELRPIEGNFIQLKLVHKLDKKLNKLIFKAIEIKETDETTTTLRKDISGLLQLKFKQNGSTLDLEDLEDDDEYFEYFGYSTNEDWIEAIRKKILDKYNKIARLEDIDEIYSIIKSIINKDNDYDVNEYQEEKFEKTYEKEITDDMFDENGKFIMDKLYPELNQKMENIGDLALDDTFEDDLYYVAMSVIADNEHWQNKIINKKPVIKAPDFAFLGEHYIPKNLLLKNKITENCSVIAKVVYTGDKWKVYQLIKK
jgi:hypothetical protein